MHNGSSIQNSFFTDLNASSIQPVDATVIFGPQRDTLLIVIPITITYVLIFITGLIGNIVTCTVIVRNKSMHTATNYYLFSLAVSDLLLLVSGMPQEIYSIWSKWPYVFGPAFCFIRGLAAETSTNASVLTITLFTIERYLAICHPFQSYKMSKLTRASKHILLLWVVSLVTALPLAMQFGIRQFHGVTMCLQTQVIINHSFEISTFIFFFAPMMLISVLYSLIGIHLYKSRVDNTNSDRSNGNILHGSIRTTKKISQSSKKVVKMLVAVVVAFFLCWAPFHAQRLVAIYGTNEQHREKAPGFLLLYSIMTYTSGVLYYLSTTINPILYHTMSHKFRNAFKITLLRLCGIRHPHIHQCSYSVLQFQKITATENSGNSNRNQPKFSEDNKQEISISKSLSTLNGSIKVPMHEQVQQTIAEHATKLCLGLNNNIQDDESFDVNIKRAQSLATPKFQLTMGVYRKNSV